MRSPQNQTAAEILDKKRLGMKQRKMDHRFLPTNSKYEPYRPLSLKSIAKA